MKLVFKRPASMTDLPFPYCPGCSHGTIHRLVAEVMDELDVTKKAIGITSAGCSVRNWRQFDCDIVMALHGRGPAVATGLKRARPDAVVFTYQGDGDLAAIGTGEIVHAASRCERITVIYVNNGVFAATGGQQAPTTLIGQKTTSYPSGRDPELSGYPIKIVEMLSGLVEVLAACPTAWKLDAVSCMERIRSEVISYYPLGTFSSPQKET